MYFGGENSMKDEIQSRICAAMQETDFDAVILYGADNFTYMSRVLLPFAAQFPEKKAAFILLKSGRMGIVTPFEWEQAIRDQGWSDKLLVYTENDGPKTEAVAGLVNQFLQDAALNSGKIGLDDDHISVADQQKLASLLPEIQWVSAENWIKQVRKIKVQSEIDILKQAAIQSDRGIIGALNHLEGTVDDLGYTMKELAERLRVHVIEFGGTGVGDLGVAQGEAAQVIYAPARGRVKTGKFLRMDFSNHYLGYWCAAGRTVLIGTPDESQLQAYADNILLQNCALEKLKPGIKAKEVFMAVKNLADANGISFFEGAGVGHGVGMSENEAPNLNALNDEILETGMVLMVNIMTYGPDGALIHNKNMVTITKEGCMLLSTFKNWDKLYAVNGFRGTH
jgi:Xaa-Pro aminopeptidase